MMKKEVVVQNNLLTRLGKTRLLPGGQFASKWLYANADFHKQKRVLEIGCGDIHTLIDLVNEFGFHVTSIIFEQDNLEKAQNEINQHELNGRINLVLVSEMKLPFKEDYFDIILAESVLTTQTDEEKKHVIDECFRVLKINGFLLTHDLMLNTIENTESITTALNKGLEFAVYPLTKPNWKQLFIDCQFRNVETYSGEINLFSPKELIQSEGVLGAVKLIGNALRPENREGVKQLYQTIAQFEHQISFIAMCSQK